MNFLNAMMALGAAAFVVPLAIHLLFRSRFKTLDWGAMFLLQDVVNANRRRMQWHQWILLALRCAIPVLLALAMARPLLSSMGGQSIAGKAAVSLILLVDDSRSMSAATRSARTRQSLSELLDSMSRGDEVVLIRSSELHSPPSSGSPRDAHDKIRELRFDGAPMDLSAMLQIGMDACRDAVHPHRRIVLVSDFQENTFHDSHEASTSSFFSSIDRFSERLAGFTPRPQLDFLDVAESEENASILANVVVESISTDVPAVLAGQPVPLTATIRNDSELPVTNLRASWLIDGRLVETQAISIEPQGTATLNWESTLKNPGGVSVGLSIEHADAIVADNRREWALEVLSPVRVWVVDGEPSRQPLQSETDFLKVALSPFAFQSAGRHRDTKTSPRPSKTATRNDLIATQVMSEATLVKQLAASLSPEQRLATRESAQRPDLIVLANVRRPPMSADGTDLLADYLTTGGRVLFFDGDEVDTSAWADCQWLPATQSEKISDPPMDKKALFRIKPPGGKLAVWALLGDEEDSLFDTIEISHLRAIAPRDKSASVWLRTYSGAPLVVEKTIPSEAATDATETSSAEVNGRVVQFAIPCDTAWSNLPLRPVFLPMMQQLVLEMVSSDFPGSVLPGTAMVIAPLSGPAIDETTVWQVAMPEGQTQTLSDSARLPLVFLDTNNVGAYRFGNVELGRDVGGRVATEQQTGGMPMRRVRVVEIPAAESDLRSVAPELLAECAERLQAERYKDAESLIAASQRARFGVEIWRPLLWLLLAVMVSEVLWQQVRVTRSANRFAPVRPGVAP